MDYFSPVLGAILITELSDQTVEGGTTVEFTCEAVASDFQPEIVWTFGGDIIAGCNEGISYCVESEKLKPASLTKSKFVIETKKESYIHHITCYVKQDQSVNDRATLTVKTGIIYLLIAVYIARRFSYTEMYVTSKTCIDRLYT